MAPALAGVYRARLAQPPMPAMEQMLTMTPLLWGIIVRAAAWLHRDMPLSMMP